MAVAIGDVFLVTMRGTCIGQRILLTHTYRVTAWSGVSTDYDLALGLAQGAAVGGGLNIETAYLNCLPDNYTLDEIRAQKVRPQRFRYAVVARGTTGVFAADALSASVAADITLWAALAGRRYVCSKHIGPLPTAVGNYVGGEVTAGQKAPLDTLRDKLKEVWTSVGLGVTFSPTIMHQPPLTGDDLIVDGITQPTVRVMRRRTVGLGE